MDHYFEIKILPDPEFMPTFLMNALYSKLHRVLVQMKCTEIGISFPNYSKEKQRLGERIRFHSNGTKHLEELMNLKWLRGMHDHVSVGTISQVPNNVSYAIFRRVQSKSNAERIRRRQIQRHNLTREEALVLIPDDIEKHLQLPFISMKSRSTEQKFRLFIECMNVSVPVQGTFNAYGLSSEATVPLF